MIIIKLNSIDFSSVIEGTDKTFVVNVSKKTEKKLQAKNITNELTFREGAFELIKQELIDAVDAKLRKIDVKAYDDCCLNDDGTPRLIFEGILQGNRVNWCAGDCFCTGQPIEHTDETMSWDCFRTTLIADDRNGFRTQTHPRLTYCNELRPDWLHDVILVFGIILNLVLAILTPIVFVISLIVQAVCAVINIATIGLVECPPGLQDGILDDYTNFINQLNEIIIGCGRQHPTPFVRSYIQNACNICGLNFQSSILNDVNSEYYNTLYFNAPVEKGTRDSSVKYIDENYPIHNGESFMEQMILPFSADWYIRNGSVIMEREDYFWSGNIWINLQQIIDEGRLIGKVCYSWRDEKQYAYARFEYSLDAVDVVGNESKLRHNDIVEWNLPFNEAQSGEFNVQLPFGMARYRGDGIDRDVLGTWENAPFLSSVISNYDDVMIMDRGVAFQPKLLIYDQNSQITDARVRKYNISGHDVSANENFNYPFMFNETNVSPLTIYPTNQPQMALYGRFFAWKQPKVSPDRGLEFSFTFSYTCDELRNFDIYKNIGNLPGMTNDGRQDETTIDYINKTITVKGKL